MSTPSSESRLDRWRSRLDAALERLRRQTGMIPESRLRESARERAAARLARHPWPAASRAALARLGTPGRQAYLVGGTVRDVLLERPGDPVLDVATPLTPDEVMARFPHVEPIGREHGTLLVIEPEIRLESTTFRREGA